MVLLLLVRLCFIYYLCICKISQMAANTLNGLNVVFPIYNADETPFHNLVLHKATYESVVMSLGDKITGDVYYKDNKLVVTMMEYIEYFGVRYMLVSPPTVVREGMVSDNSGLNGMTKYSFEFYHPMCMLANIPFTDIAVNSGEEKYLSQNKTFSWIGNLIDFVAKLNRNLDGTQWIVDVNGNEEMMAKMNVLSDVLSFDKNYISEALKTAYDTWEVPFVIDTIPDDDETCDDGKKFLILFGTPSNEIKDSQGENFVFRFGQGVGLKNNSRTPKNNKIVTRIVGYGSENNIPYGYPQIRWYGDPTATQTPDGYPIYKGIVGGQYVNLIKHPFTRETLMPSVYVQTVFNKVSPYLSDGSTNPNYNPNLEIVDYYDADGSYVNPINPSSPSVEIHQFEDIKPELGEERIVSAVPYDSNYQGDAQEYTSLSDFLVALAGYISSSRNENERAALTRLREALVSGATSYGDSNNGGSYTFSCVYSYSGSSTYIKYTSDNVNFEVRIGQSSQPQWDDTMNDDGEYIQSYFKITLPVLSFDLYACASITEEMKINMRSGACIGCTFPIQVDWDDYKKNFYDSDGSFLPDGQQRDLGKYPKSNQSQITVIVKKEIETFGTLMPNIYQYPTGGDKFVILGISLPDTYVSNAEARLDDAMQEYMRENNIHYYDYPLKFDEYFLATHTDILAQMHNNTIVRFQYGGELPKVLYIKQITIKYGESTLPKYDITLTDDVEIVLNQIGQVTDDVSRMRVQVSELQKYYSQNIVDVLNEKLSRAVDDVCLGRITFQQGLDSLGSTIFHDEIRSPQFQTGLYDGRGWRIDNLGNAEFESARIRSYLEVVELLINRLQAQEGDTLYTDNDQVDKVEKVVDETDGSVSYILSLKEKYDGYVTGQMYGNILKGIINTLAAKQAGISDESGTSVEVDGANKYYTSWARVIGTHNTNNLLGINQIQVVLYGDDYVPAGRNFEPCELMTIAH